MKKLNFLNKSVLYTVLILGANICFAVDIPRKFHLDKINIIADHTLDIRVTVKSKDADISWNLSPSDRAIFYRKLPELRTAKEAYQPLDIPEPQKMDYHGLAVTIIDHTGKQLLPFTVHNSLVTDERSDLIVRDPHRMFEYWLWSTHMPVNAKHVHKALPIIDFKQCASLNLRIVDTSPRQCLVENTDIFLDVPDKPTQKSLEIDTFDECLVEGQALINAFPRRCIAAGGHVFSEPPRIKYETPSFSQRTKKFTLSDFEE